jgi:hypothetical protein
MKILIVGSWLYTIYEKSIADALVEIGHEVQSFSWAKYFSSDIGRVEQKYSIAGPNTRKFNNDLIAQIALLQPDMVLTWRATIILPSTLKTIKILGVKYLISYNHDDFSGPRAGAPVPLHHYFHWRLFLKAAKYYDCHFVKRVGNAKHLKALGSKNNHVILMWFVPSLHRPVTLIESDIHSYGCDAVFVGHYEPDKRVEYLRALVQSGIYVKLFGSHYWTPKVLGDLYRYFAPITTVEGDDYAKALCGAKICLAFLSKLNRDTYTRRCFEIPACRRVMLAERTKDLTTMFAEDKEACYFSNTGELVAKARWLLNNPHLAQEIALAGYRRVWAERHDVKSRAIEMLSKILKAEE